MIISFHADDTLTELLSIYEFEDFDFAMNEFLKISLFQFSKFIISSKETLLDHDILDFEEKHNEIN